MNWTDSQKKAIDIPVSDIIVSAAAGSGKTAVMAERIINRLTGDNHVDIDKILVVTYTNAAASEIKERVMKKIVEKMSESNNEILQKQLILIDNSHFCTIHSFCLELIKKYFYKLEIDPGVKTGDPADLKVILEQAVSNVTDEYFLNKDAEYENLVNSYGNGKVPNFEKIILDVYKFSRTMPDSNSWLDGLPKLYSGCNDTAQKCIVDYSLVHLSFVKDELAKAIELITQSDCCVEWLANIEHEYSMVNNALICKEGYERMYNLVSAITFDRLPNAKSAKDSRMKAKIKALRDNAKKEIADLIKKFYCIAPEQLKADNESLVSVVAKIVEVTRKIGKEFDRLKRQKNLIDFSDYEHMTLKLLKNQDGSPSDIAKSVSEDFEEIYIDEYQDCNNIQNEIFKYISGALYGRPNMFCVGDMKQSIYKFRDANPLNFKNKCDTSVEYDGIKTNLSNKILLNANFRSRKSILDFVNSTFYQLMSKTCGELEYTNEEALSYGASFSDVNNNINQIEIDIINESNDFGDGFCTTEDTVYSKQDVEVIHIASRIKKMVESGYLLYDAKKQETRKARYGDIAILFRSPADYVSSIEKIFSELKIPHICDASGDFFDTEEIGFLIALLKIIDNPDDDIALVTVLKNPIIGFDENMLLKIKLASRKESYYKSVLEFIKLNDGEICEKLNAFIQKLNNYHLKSKYMEIGDFILYVITDLKYYAYLSSFSDSEIRKNNVRIFIGKARDFDKESFKGIFRFVKYIDNIKQTKNDISAKSVGENDDVVRITSIHKSKGLEFPIVFLSGTGKLFNTTDTTGRILLHKDLGIGVDAVCFDKGYRVPTLNKLAIKQKIKYETMSEELRVLYVALTRPTEKLIITGSVKDGASFLNSIQNSLQFQKYQISPHLIVKSKSFLETILLSSMRCENFESASVEKDGIIISDGVTYSVNLFNKCDIKSTSFSGVITDWKSQFQSVTSDYENMLSIFNHQYPYCDSSDIPGNLSVTEIKKLTNSDEDKNSLFDDFVLEKPKNFSSPKNIAGNVFGTLIHLCMEKLDLSTITNESDIVSQLSFLEGHGVISSEERSFVDSKKIHMFLNSEIGKRIMSHYNTLRREFSFKYLENASDILKTNTNDKIVVQGTIDAFFEDDDGSLVIVDYKTDKVHDGDVDAVVQRYSVQLNCYSKALESILHKKVKEKIIYLFDTNEAVCV